jgi:predicted permease
MAGRRHYRLQSTLVVAQTAMGLVLLVCAGLLIRSFERTLKTDPGFAPDGLVTFRVSVPKQCCGEPTQVQFVQQLIARMKALPGVRSASAAYPLPLNQGDMTISFSIQGRPNAPGGEPSARASVAEPDYFKTMGIPLKSGRFFLTTEQDRKGAAVAIVNEAFAKKFFPGENAVGQHILSGLGSGDGPDDNPPMREIVGVVGNVKRLSLTEPDQPEYYVPFEQAPITMPGIAMRVAGDPESYAPMITAEVAKLDRNLPVYHFGTYADDMRRVTAEQRFQTLLLTGFAAMALILTGLGLYGVLSYMVAQRTQELGLRIALGATRGNVLQLVLNRGLSMTAVGIVAGIAGAAALTRFLAGLLYAVKPLDAATFLVTTLVLLAVSSLACLIPAIKACKLDPNQTLRQP